MEQIFLTKAGTWLLMLTVVGLIILILRVLFGPRGFLRDPAWDKRNQEIRAQEQAAREARLKAWHEEHNPQKNEQEHENTGN